MGREGKEEMNEDKEKEKEGHCRGLIEHQDSKKEVSGDRKGVNHHTEDSVTEQCQILSRAARLKLSVSTRPSPRKLSGFRQSGRWNGIASDLCFLFFVLFCSVFFRFFLVFFPFSSVFFLFFRFLPFISFFCPVFFLFPFHFRRNGETVFARLLLRNPEK